MPTKFLALGRGIFGLGGTPEEWESDFYTPPVLANVAFLRIQRQVCKIWGPWGTEFLYTAGAELSKRATPPSPGGA